MGIGSGLGLMPFSHISEISSKFWRFLKILDIASKFLKLIQHFGNFQISADFQEISQEFLMGLRLGDPGLNTSVLSFIEVSHVSGV